MTLTVTALDGGTFERWIGYGCEANPNPVCTMTMDKGYGGFISIKPLRYPVTITGAGNGTGTVRNVETTIAQPQLACRITRGVAAQTFCATTYPYGSRVWLEHQTGFTDGSRLVGYEGCALPGCMAVVEGPLVITARFVAPRIDIVGTGTGNGRVVGAGANGLDCTITARETAGNCSRNSDVTTPTTLAFTATPNAGSMFAGWGGLCTGSGACSTNGAEPPSNTQLVARFERVNHSLTIAGAGTGVGTVESSPGGIGCIISAGSTVNACVAPFGEGTAVTLSATPNAGSRFAGWDGACTGTTACTVTMTASRTVTARFEATTTTLTTTGTGSGTVTSTPNGIGCTLANGALSGICTATFPVGSTVSLAAAPASGWTFAGWGGACSGGGACQVDLGESRTVSASFTRAPMALTLAGAGTGNGLVTAAPGGLSCVITKGTAAATGCTVTLDQNTSVTLSADPQGGSTFAGWEGDACSGTQASCTFSLAQARTVTARFTAPRVARDLALVLLGAGTLSPEERQQLDRFGNEDGTFNLGDLLALLDRTGERLTPATAAALMAAPRPSAATAPRRAP